MYALINESFSVFLPCSETKKLLEKKYSKVLQYLLYPMNKKSYLMSLKVKTKLKHCHK